MRLKDLSFRKINRNFLLSLTLFIMMVFSVIIINASSQSTAPKYVKKGDWIKYGFSATNFFVPYGEGDVKIVIVDIQDTANVKINVTRGNEVLETAIPADYYILNNQSIHNDLTQCPINNQSTSEICAHWNQDYISQSKDYYNDVERDIIELSYSALGDYEGDIYNVTAYWAWDYETGVLLNSTFYFNNTNPLNAHLSGLYSQYLIDTNIWSLTTGGGNIPGFDVLLFAPILLPIIIWKIRSVRRDNNNCNSKNNANNSYENNRGRFNK